MSRGPCTFRQQDVTRAIKAAKAAGVEVAQVEIDKNGKIVIRTPTAVVEPVGEPNEWDNAQ